MDYESDNIIYTPGKFKYIEAKDNINNVNNNGDIYQKNFVNGLKNARQILNNLQKSIQKSTKYEKQLIKCRCSHHHSHIGGWNSDFSDYKTNKFDKPGEIKKNNELLQSVTSLDGDDLKFQYEELYRRYETLHRAYDERCRAMAAKDLELAETRRSVRDSYEELAQAHRTLISMGEKYLALKCKNQEQKQIYSDKLQHLRLALRSMAGEVERARGQFDVQLGCSVRIERDAATALLLHEIKKCNLLYMDNVRLKELLAEITTQDD